MPETRRLASWLQLEPPPLPQEILAAVFSAACQAGLTIDGALHAMRGVGRGISPELAEEIAQAAVRLSHSVDRQQTYARLSAESASPLLKSLFASLATAEISGEETVTRSRQLFESLSAKRDELVQKRAETYPLIMIVVMVLFFIPAIVVMLVGPLYLRLMQVLTAI